MKGSVKDHFVYKIISRNCYFLVKIYELVCPLIVCLDYRLNSAILKRLAEEIVALFSSEAQVNFRTFYLLIF